LTAFDNLIFSMQLYGVPRRERVPRADELLTRFRLSDKRDTAFRKLSRGMKRALTIAAALAHEPALLFLDEPTTGLDVISARNLRQMIAGLRQEGVTVFLTTHYLEEAERLCDRIALLVQGQIVALDTVAGLKAQVREATALEITTQGADGPPETRRFVGEDTASLMREALTEAEAEGGRVLAVQTLQPTLEDVFIELTGLSAEQVEMDKAGKGT
jgi:ABC-2 type transport system ATP-binding protein